MRRYILEELEHGKNPNEENRLLSEEQDRWEKPGHLKKYEEETKIAIRFSLRNLSFDGKILNVPLYLIDELDRLIDIAKMNSNDLITKRRT